MIINDVSSTILHSYVASVLQERKRSFISLANASRMIAAITYLKI